MVNPPGTALVFLSLTEQASVATRRSLARRVAINAFFVMAASLLVGAFILKICGISVPVLRVAALTLPLTTGPGTTAVTSLLAAIVIAAAIYVRFDSPDVAVARSLTGASLIHALM